MYTIEDNDGIIDTVTQSSQYRCDEKVSTFKMGKKT